MDLAVLHGLEPERIRTSTSYHHHCQITARRPITAQTHNAQPFRDTKQWASDPPAAGFEVAVALSSPSESRDDEGRGRRSKKVANKSCVVELASSLGHWGASPPLAPRPYPRDGAFHAFERSPTVPAAATQLGGSIGFGRQAPESALESRAGGSSWPGSSGKPSSGTEDGAALCDTRCDPLHWGAASRLSPWDRIGVDRPVPPRRRWSLRRPRRAHGAARWGWHARVDRGAHARLQGEIFTRSGTVAGRID